MANVTIQPSTIDTYLVENSPTTNTGTAVSFRISPTTATHYRAILKFDFSAVVPAGATITLATLSLYTATTLASRIITIYRLLRTDWVETEATWNIYKTGSSWGTAGALAASIDFTAASAATAASVAVGQWLNETVTAQVQTALDSVGGVAHFLVADVGATATGHNAYASRETPTTGNRPKLYIEYTMPGLTVTFDSQGGSAISPITGIASGAAVTLPSPPTRTGYTFGGWWTGTGSGGSQFTDSTPVTADTTVYAKWTINQYTATFRDWDGTVLSTSTVDYYTAATAPSNPTRTEYIFTGWDVSFANMVANIDVTAVYTPVYSITIPLERGPHSVYVQATDSVGTIATSPITYVMAYELSEFGIDVYSGDAKLDAIEPVLHDVLLPDLPTLNFSCATLLTGNIGVIIRERGLRKYQFTIDTVSISGPYYVYTCLAAESYALTTAIMALQTAYGATSDAIKLLVPSLNIVNAQLLTQTTYPQLFGKITPLEVINQLMIQALAQASVRNGNLYAFPLDVSTQIPDYHMQRLDPLTGWQRDSRIYNAVEAHYIVKQYPTPDTVLTLNDHANWTGTVSDVTQVADTLLPVPSGALGMLKSVGNASRAGLSMLFKYFDRIAFNWNPVTATSVTVSLQQDASNKLELTHAFTGQIGAGFVLQGAPGVPTDTLTKNITLSPVQYVKTVTGTVTANCSYRVTLLTASGATLWQDAWRSTIGNTFEADVPLHISQTHLVTTVRIEFMNLYLIADNYGVQCIACYVRVQSYNNVGSHQLVDSNSQYTNVQVMISSRYDFGNYTMQTIVCPIPTLVGNQTCTATLQYARITYWNTNLGQSYVVDIGGSIIASGGNLTWYVPFGSDGNIWIIGGFLDFTVVVSQIVQDYAWVSSYFTWSNAFNLFEAVNLAFVDFVRTGNPVNLQTIAFTFSGDNYVDTLCLVADNPVPATVRAGTGSRAFIVTDDFGSEAGAQQYADGLLPIMSVAREQYTRDVPLETDLGVGDTIDGDDVNYTIRAVDYRQDGKTLVAGRSMDILKTQLAEYARRLDSLERKT